MNLTSDIPEGNDAQYNTETCLENSEVLESNRSSTSSWTCVGPFDFDKDANGPCYAPCYINVYIVG